VTEFEWGEAKSWSASGPASTLLRVIAADPQAVLRARAPRRAVAKENAPADP